MSNIDDRIINLKLDDNSLQEGATRATSTLSKLASVLKMKGATEGLAAVDDASKKVDLSLMQKAAENVAGKFTMLRMVAANALGNIASQAAFTGANLVKSLTLAPVLDGFREYETQMNSVQTILANTASKGSTIKDVNKALAELNTYADKTIYNFTEMTRNIGTFTAAGVDLDTSVQSIKGIANLAAVSGSNSQQASTAMYQLSQAISSGTVRLMDWNSVVNAGMGGEVFQKALERTSTKLKTGATEAIKAKGSFRESLQTGWLTTEVLTETLKQFQLSTDTATQYNNTIKTLVSQGYTQEQAKQIADMAKTAGDAATKVKTFSQLIDTLKEAVGSGWTNTFQTLFGDFEEARESWTALSNVLGDIVSNSATARNTLLNGWADLGGRKELFGIFTDSLKLVMSYLGPLKEGFRDIFPPTTAQTLFNITKGIHDFIKNITLSTSQMKILRETVRNFLSPLGLLKDGFDSLFKIIFHNAPKSGTVINSVLVVLNSLSKVVAFVTDGIRSFIKGFNSGTKIFEGFGSLIQKITGYFKELGGQATSTGQGFSDFSSKLGSSISSGLDAAGKKIGAFTKEVFGSLGKAIDWLKENISLGDIFGALIGTSAVVMIHKFTGLIDKIKSTIDKIGSMFKQGGDSAEKGASVFKEVFSSLNSSLQAFTQGIRVASLVAISVAIGLLVDSLQKLSGLSAPDIAVGLASMAAMMVMLNLSMKSISKTVNRFDTKGIVKTGLAMILFAKAIDILAGALKSMGSMSWDEIGRGLVAMGGAMAEMAGAMKLLSFSKTSISTALSTLIVAKAMELIAEPLKTLGAMDWPSIGRGLTAMGGALGEMAVAITAIGKISGFSSLFASGSILIVVSGLDDISTQLKSFGDMSWDEIGRGLTAMGGALAEVAGVIIAVDKISGFSSLFASGALAIVMNGLLTMAQSFNLLAKNSWDEIGRGLTAMGGALAEVAGISGALGKIAGLSGVLGAGTILIVIQGLDDLADALIKFGSMEWDEIGRGLTAMGVSLLIVGGMSAALGMIGGISGLIGAGTILLAVQGLDDLADALIKFGSMEWDEIGRGLTAMAGALLVVGGMSTALGMIGGLAGVIGAGTILLVVQGLDDLADALIKFGSMDWDEIGRGITAMAGAMGAAGLGAVLNTLSGLGAEAIKTYAKPLGDLADSVKKWADVTVPTDLSSSLGSLAAGVNEFTLSGWGADAISKIPKPLGQLADSVKKWDSVSVPAGIKQQLKDLSDGVASFWNAGWGGDVVSKIIKPIGQLAGSVEKWKSVSVPAGIKQQLKDLSDGVGSFWDADWGGDVLSKITGPIGDLANAIKKWSGVTVPGGIKKNLESLAGGIAAFGDRSIDGAAMSSVVRPLGNMAGAVAKWANVIVPTGLKKGLLDIKKGVASFTGIGDATSQLTKASHGIGAMASSMANISVATLSGVSTKLKDLGKSISIFASTAGPSIGSLNTASKALISLGNASFNASGKIRGIGAALTSFEVVSSAGIDRVNAKISSIPGHVLSAKGSISSISGAANTMASNVVAAFSRVNGSVNGAKAPLSGFVSASNSTAKGVVAAFSTIASNIQSILNKTTSTISSFNSKFHSSGHTLSMNLIKGMKSGTDKISSTYSASINSALSSARSNYNGFHKAGAYLAEGFANGIRSGTNGAINAASNMAAKALVAAKHAADEHSPSKKAFQIGDYIGKGMENGIVNSTDAVVDKAYSMGSQAIDSLNKSATKVPVISPVYDLSSLSTGSKAIDKLMNNTSLSLFDGKLSVPNLDYKDPRVSALAQYQSQMVDTNSRMISKLDSLNDNMTEYQKAIENQELGVYMDGDKVASRLARPMNQQLGRLSRREKVR